MDTPGSIVDNNQSSSLEALQAEVEKLKVELARSQKIQKDTQAEFTRRSQENKSLKAQIDFLKSEAKKVDVDYNEELEKLMYDDPRAWRAKLTEIETQKAKNLDSRLVEISDKFKGSSQEELFDIYLNEFNSDKGDLPLTKEQLEFDIPQRLKSKLHKNDLSVPEYFSLCYDYLKQQKTFDNVTKPVAEPDLSKMGTANISGQQQFEGEDDLY